VIGEACTSYLHGIAHGLPLPQHAIAEDSDHLSARTIAFSAKHGGDTAPWKFGVDGDEGRLDGSHSEASEEEHGLEVTEKGKRANTRRGQAEDSAAGRRLHHGGRG
jgi:hypothetical protein